MDVDPIPVNIQAHKFELGMKFMGNPPSAYPPECPAAGSLSRQEERSRSESPFDKRAGSRRDHVLDGIRAVAVLCVIVGHFILFRLSSLSTAVPPFADRAAGSLAVTGVEIFFLISGYVITRLLLIERQSYGRTDLLAFYVRRVVRIMPPFYAYLATVAFLSLSGYLHTPIVETALAAAFLCNTGLPCGWFVGHSWSLAVEEQFYLVWPSVFVLIFGRELLPVILAVISALLAYSLFRGFVPFANNMSFLYIGIGALVATSRPLQARIVEHVRGPVWFASAVLLLAGILLLPDRLMLAGKPLLLMTLVFGAANVGFVRGLLQNRVFQSIGTISYSLYLWQELFMARVEDYNGRPPSILLLPVVAWLSWYIIEKPGIAFGRRFTRKRRDTAIALVTKETGHVTPVTP